MFDRQQETSRLTSQIVDGIASYNGEQQSPEWNDHSRRTFKDKQKIELEFLEDVFTHKKEDTTGRKQLSIAEQVRELDQSTIEASILGSTQFKEAKPTLALALLDRDFRIIHDPKSGNGITIGELKTYRDQDKRINSLDKALIDYVLHEQNGTVDDDRFNRLRGMVRTDKIPLLGGNSVGITRSDIEEARDQIRAMLKSREVARTQLDSDSRASIGRGMKFLSDHAGELTTTDRPYEIKQSAIDQFTSRHSADRELSREAKEVSTNFGLIKEYVHDSDEGIDIRRVRNHMRFFSEDEEKLRRQFNQAQEQWNRWLDR